MKKTLTCPKCGNEKVEICGSFFERVYRRIFRKNKYACHKCGIYWISHHHEKPLKK